jgi:hypothetical protein
MYIALLCPNIIYFPPSQIMMCKKLAQASIYDLCGRDCTTSYANSEKKQVIERKSLYGLRESILDTKYLRSIIFYMPITTPFNNK